MMWMQWRPPKSRGLKISVNAEGLARARSALLTNPRPLRSRALTGAEKRRRVVDRMFKGQLDSKGGRVSGDLAKPKERGHPGEEYSVPGAYSYGVTQTLPRSPSFVFSTANRSTAARNLYVSSEQMKTIARSETTGAGFTCIDDSNPLVGMVVNKAKCEAIGC